MARLPQPGGDKGDWGEILNDFLSQSIEGDGSLKVDTVGAPQLKPGSVTTASIANNSVTLAKLHDVGQPNGLATLNADSKLDEVQLPERLSEVEIDNTVNSAIATAVEGFSHGNVPEIGGAVKKIQHGSADVVFTIVGDSTGQGDTTTSKRWPLLFAEGLATKFPTHTVIFYLWNSTAVAYDSPLTVGTGSSGRTITIYSGSASGETPLYSMTNLSALSPVRPDVLLISHGHNVNATSYPVDTANLVASVRVRHPGVAVILVSQNPRQLGTSGYEGQMAVRDATVTLAVRLGLGLLDITSVFQAVPDYSTALMLDDRHPNANGYQLWADALLGVVSTSASTPAKVIPVQQPVIHFPAGMFTPSAGSPNVVGSANNGSPFGGWALDPTVVESVGLMAVIPTDWEKIKVRVYWGVNAELGGNAGAAVLRVSVKPMPTSFPGAFGVTHDLGGITTRTLSGSGEQGRLNTIDWQVDTSFELTERGQNGLVVQRFATTGADTLNMDLVFYGLDLIRVL